MPWPLPSAKNYGHDATMRGFRTELHESASAGRAVSAPELEVVRQGRPHRSSGPGMR